MPKPVVKTALFIEGNGDHVIAHGGRVFLLVNDRDNEKSPDNLAVAQKAADFLKVPFYSDGVPNDNISDLISRIKDNRPEVLVAYIEGRDLVVDTLGYFTHGKGSRLLQNLVKELGLAGVSRGSEGEPFDYLIPEEITGQIPEYGYHGTTSTHMYGILRNGLMPDQSETNYPGFEGKGKIEHRDAVFFTEDISNAAYQSDNAARRKKGFPVIIKVKIPDQSLLLPDYDVGNLSTHETFYPEVYRPERKRHDPSTEEHPFNLSKKFGIFGYKGRIPANFIVDILIKTNPEEVYSFNYDDWISVNAQQLEQAIEYDDPSMALYEPEEELCEECGNELHDCVCDEERMVAINTDKVYKYSYDNIEEVLNQMPISYNDMGNDPTDMPYALIGGQVYLGEPGQNHSQLFGQKLKDLFGGGREGEMQSFKHFSEGYSGRFDFTNNAITIRIFGGKYSTPTPDVIETIKQVFREQVAKRGLPEPAFIAIMPSSNNDPIMTEEGNWELYSSGDGFVKLAQQQIKIPSNYYQQEFTTHIADCDRYITDRYDIILSLREKENQYSIGYQINSAQLGVASHCQYWHYAKNELSAAKNTFNRVKKISIQLRDTIEYGDAPMSVILPMFRFGLQEIDIGHRENSGIYNYNKAREIAIAPDWRETLYGSRYPSQTIGILSDNWNSDDKSREIELTGHSNRGTIYKYKYAGINKEANIFNYMGKHWPFFGTAAAFFAWYASVGGTLTGFQKYVKPVIEQSQQVYEHTNQMQDLEILQPAVERALQESENDDNTSQSVDLNQWYDKIITQESSGRSDAISNKGARGLMQIMEPTWKEWTKKIYGTELDFELADNPEINKKVGITYLGWIQDTLRKWMSEEPDIEHILAAYNGGIGRLRKNKYNVWQMPGETKDYINKITGMQPPKGMTEITTPKIRSKNIPPNLIPPFSSRQVAIVQDKKAYQQIDKSTADLVRFLSDQSKGWHEIVAALIAEKVPKEWFGELNQIYLMHHARYGNTLQKNHAILGSKSKHPNNLRQIHIQCT